MNELRYFSPHDIELADIRQIAEKNGYRCTGFTLIQPDGTPDERLTVHFKYERDGELKEYFWQWTGGTHYGYQSAPFQADLDEIEDWRRERYVKRQPPSLFIIRYELFSLPYLVQFFLLVLKQYSGWVEDSFSETMYSLALIDDLPQATAQHLLKQAGDEDEADDPAD